LARRTSQIASRWVKERFPSPARSFSLGEISELRLSLVNKISLHRAANGPRWAFTAVILLIAAVVVTRADPASVQSAKIATHSLLPQASVGKDYTFQFRSLGKSEPLNWKLFTPVPGRWDWDGWKLEPGGRLSGKVSGADCDASGGGCPENWICGPAKRCEGIVSFYVSTSNLKGEYEQRLFDLVVTDPANPLAVGNFPTLTAGAVGQAYEAQFYARGGSAPFSWRTLSALPPGLSLGSDGVLSGLPTAAGSFTWTVEVTDSSSKKSTQKINLRIDNLSEPIVFTPDPRVVIQSTTPRIGLNVGDTGEYYNDVKLYNQYIENPGLEPRRPVRRMYWAWAGSANTLEEHNYAQFAAVEELNSGFWDGGRYWILSGPAKGREGRIAKYERVSDKNVEGGYRAVWTLSDSDRSRIIKKTPASEFDKDIFMVESLPRNVTDPKTPRVTVPPGWLVLGEEGVTFSVDKVRPPGGTQSAKIVSTNDGKVGLSSPIIWDNPWRRLRSDTTYTFSLYVRQAGVEDGKVVVQLAEPFWTAYPPSFDKNFVVPDDGKFHRITGEFAGKGQGSAGFQVLIEGKGTLWLDNVLLYESLATKSAASEPRQPSVRSKPFEPLPSVVDDLQKLKAGSLRFWYHDTWLPLENALTAATEAAPNYAHNIFSNLRLAEVTGRRAWIITAKEWLPSEFAQLAEYLSSKDTTNGLGKLRAEQGHPLPWTDTLERIYIEYQDEAWNWPQWAYPFDLWHPQKYASFAKERFNAFRASKYYSPKVMLVANGQLADDYWVNDPVDKLTYPAHDAMDIAPYVDTFGSTPLNELSATVLWEVTGFAKTMQDTMKIWSSRGEKTRMLIYEGGPGPEGYKPAAGSEVRKNSMTLVSLGVDSIADLFAHGAEEYHMGGYQANVAWQVITGSTSRFRLPIWYGISMFNAACADRALVETKIPAGTPSLKGISQDGAGKRGDGEAVPAISVRSYLTSGRKSFLVINRNPLVEYPVILRTMDNGVSYRVTTLAASRAEKGTLEGLGLLPTDMAERDLSKIVEAVQPAVMEVKSTDGGVRIILPPASIVTIQ